MGERNHKVRWILTGIFSVAVFMLLTTAAGLLTDIADHLKHFKSSYFTVLKHHVETGFYIFMGFRKPTPPYYMAWTLSFFYAAWNSYRVFRINTDTRRKYKQRHGYAAYGTAHWQEKFETVNFYHHDNNGILLGDYKKDTYKPLPKAAFENPKIDSYSVHSFADRLNQQLLVFGPPGAGKTTGFILPNIFHLLQQGKSMVVTDPKGELYEHTANAAREEGYNVVVLDYLHFKYGARQNLLNYIFAEEQYAELASMYLTATRAEGEKGDFWESKAKELLTALIGFVHQAYGSKGTLTHVYELTQYVANDPNYLRYLFEKYNIQGAPKLLMEGVLGGSKAESMMASLTGTLSERLNLFTLSNVRAQTSTTDYDLSKLAEEKTIVYIWTSVSQETYKPLISTFWTVFFNTMYETARKHGGSLPFLVECLMDEMANIGKIGGLVQKLTTMRSLKLYPMMIWHSYPQMKAVYGQDNADAIMGACDTKVILACNDMPTADLFSKMIGDTTIETQSKRGTRAVMTEGTNITSNFAGRKLLKPEELLSLDPKFSVVLQSGRPPVLLQKIQYRHWDYKICPPAKLDDLPNYQGTASELPGLDDLEEQRPKRKNNPYRNQSDVLDESAVTEGTDDDEIERSSQKEAKDPIRSQFA